MSFFCLLFKNSLILNFFFEFNKSFLLSCKTNRQAGAISQIHFSYII